MHRQRGRQCLGHPPARKKERVRHGRGLRGASWVLSPEGTSRPPSFCNLTWKVGADDALRQKGGERLHQIAGPVMNWEACRQTRCRGPVHGAPDHPGLPLQGPRLPPPHTCRHARRLHAVCRHRAVAPQQLAVPALELTQAISAAAALQDRRMQAWSSAEGSMGLQGDPDCSGSGGAGGGLAPKTRSSPLSRAGSS